MSIFVSIPSYRDPECQWTIQDLFTKAEQPDRVFVGVCDQSFPEEDKHCFEPENVRTIHLDWTEARGPCLARHHAQSLYRDEEYYLSIDSHTRFTEHWDSRLIALLASCPSPKPIITGYPAGYELPSELSDEPRPPFLCVKGLDKKDGMLRLHGRVLNQPFKKPVPSLFWVSGFSFSRAEMLKEVPYDPHLLFLFFGEESSMSARLWTHGWDFFAPPEHFIYHLWSRSYRPTFRELPDQESLMATSLLRVKYLLGMYDLDESEGEAEVDGKEKEAEVPNLPPSWLVEIEQYGLGNHEGRDLAAFQRFTGVDFKAGTVESRSLWGGLDKTAFVDGLLEFVMGNMMAKNT